MRLGFFGDVVGRAGRAAVTEHLPRVRAKLDLDFVIVNGENAAGGFGITPSTAQEIFDAGADCITLGNHSWDQAEALTYIEREPRLLRPFNYPQSLNIPGRGAQAEAWLNKESFRFEDEPTSHRSGNIPLRVSLLQYVPLVVQFFAFAEAEQNLGDAAAVEVDLERN